MQDFSNYAWLIMAGILVAAEIATGTFYLLMLGIAAAITWFAERMGISFLAQTLVFLIVSIVLCYATQQYRKKHISTDNKVNDLDAGEIITVTNWQNGMGKTHYRGAQWQVVMLENSTSPADGQYRIVRFDGNRLLVQAI